MLKYLWKDRRCRSIIVVEGGSTMSQSFRELMADIGNSSKILVAGDGESIGLAKGICCRRR